MKNSIFIYFTLLEQRDKKYLSYIPSVLLPSMSKLCLTCQKRLHKTDGPLEDIEFNNKTQIGSHQEGFQDANKMFHFLYMGMSGSMAVPQRAELMERVGVIPYLNDRQERIKGEC